VLASAVESLRAGHQFSVINSCKENYPSWLLGMAEAFCTP